MVRRGDGGTPRLARGLPSRSGRRIPGKRMARTMTSDSFTVAATPGRLARRILVVDDDRPSREGLSDGVAPGGSRGRRRGRRVAGDRPAPRPVVRHRGGRPRSPGGARSRPRRLGRGPDRARLPTGHRRHRAERRRGPDPGPRGARARRDRHPRKAHQPAGAHAPRRDPAAARRSARPSDPRSAPDVPPDGSPRQPDGHAIGGVTYP